MYNPDNRPCLDVEGVVFPTTTDQTHPDVVIPSTTDQTHPDVVLPSITIPEIPNFPPIILDKIPDDIVINIPPIVFGGCCPPDQDIYVVRNLINTLIGLLSAPNLIPPYIGCPPSDLVAIIRHDAISLLAKGLWYQAGQPKGRDQEFWYGAERRFNNAFKCWF